VESMFTASNGVRSSCVVSSPLKSVSGFLCVLVEVLDAGGCRDPHGQHRARMASDLPKMRKEVYLGYAVDGCVPDV